MLKKLLFFVAIAMPMAGFAGVGFTEESAIKGKTTSPADLTLRSDIELPKSLAAHNAGPCQAISRVEDIAGSYLMFFQTPVTNTVVDYTEVTVAKKDVNHITIEGFWSSTALTLTASVNLSEGTISIPSQAVYVSSTYGECDLAPWYVDEENGNKVTPVRSVEIPGRIDGDKIVLDTYAWGIFINSGTYKDSFIMLGTYTDFIPVNGEDETVGLSDGSQTRNAVNIALEGDDIIVKNFAGFGREVTITMESDRMNVHVDRQTVYSYYDDDTSAEVEYKCYALTDDNKVSTTKKITGTVTKQEVNLGKWALLVKTGASSYSGIAYNSYKLYFTDGSTFNAAGVEGTTSAADVVNVKYFNLQGIESAHPFDGLNIVVETRTDGTISATKRAFKVR